MFRTAAEGQVLARAQPSNVRALERLSRNATRPALLLRILGIRIGATPQGTTISVLPFQLDKHGIAIAVVRDQINTQEFSHYEGDT